MAGRKRMKKVDHENQGDVKVCPAKLRSLHCENAPGAETEQLSPYFKKHQQHRLGEDFFNQPCISLAKAFLGKVLVRQYVDGTELRGRIVETEAYLGGEDKASHSAGGKRTERNTAMFMKPGTIYVYPIYGIYLCMNVSSQGEGAAVLLRSLEPLQGQPIMRQLRAARRRDGAKPLKDKELCNGPSKLCQALNIPRCFDRRDLASDPEVWLEKDPQTSMPETHDLVAASRIGVESHGEWATKPLRFYLRGHPCVSVVNKEAERQALSTSKTNNLDFSEVQSDTGQHNATT
ncbi:DNA-3-methyladenine glycosylase isoform X2 [Myripristis murdjan]|uniref:DNA-3-methyladenine glycosylase n=2 Tax=Myripristis murdjan TaxID=586833 RepID=A0A668AN37_9TELE|nr:DNA-3-methyladenine glycosylase isoform X2 [Myripristis murdjan]XP_029913727.1 DNA-3-methyladenine glycosylase isoform X2 [Myripristis murdjan]XP_029913728.1 DNA-3-methyladenine glycosylase isoform X2 [Myripristis murdjan]